MRSACPSEFGISAVYLAQIHQPVSLLYLCAVLLHTMPEPEPELLEGR